MLCGIYKITNNITNKCYIGKSVDIERRFKEHKNSKDNFAIHTSIKKYGNFAPRGNGIRGHAGGRA